MISITTKLTDFVKARQQGDMKTKTLGLLNL